MTLPFARTVCACPDDVANCKKKPGMLMPADIEPILDKIVTLGLAPDHVAALAYLKATPGAKGLRLDPDGPKIITIPTISPRTIDGHRCVFLNADDRCDIHEVAPAGCAAFDVHMSKGEGQRRSVYIHRLIMESRLYTRLRQILIRRDQECSPLPTSHDSGQRSNNAAQMNAGHGLAGLMRTATEDSGLAIADGERIE